MTATLLRLLTGVRAQWVGFDPSNLSDCAGCRVFFANHTSNLDGPTIWASLPPHMRRVTRPVAAQDYWTKGPIRRYLANEVFRCVLIERLKVTRANHPLQPMLSALEAGESLIIFPEGTRSMDDDGALGVFRPGIFHLARSCAQAEFVPVYLENLNRIMPKGDFLLIPLIATVYFGKPIRLETGESKESFLNRAKAAVEALRKGEASHA